MAKKKHVRHDADEDEVSLSRVFWRYLLYISGVVGVLVLLWGGYLDFQVRGSLAGKLWSIPAKVYARPLELYVGANLRQIQVIQELKRLGYQATSQINRPGTYAVDGRMLHIYTRAFQFWDGEEAAQRVHLGFSGNDGITSLQAASVQTSLVRLEPYVIGGIYPEHNEDRVLISLEEVPPYFVAALLATEDRQFFRHHGISPKGMLRALWVNAAQGRLVQGGSTLTQQLIKNIYLSNERKLSRKLTEAYMALLLEMHYSKQQILQAYLNEVYLGQSGSRAIHGFGLASEFYFGRPFGELRLHQVAMLVAIIKGPSYYNPYRHGERVKERRNEVIDLILQTKLISAEEARQAKSKPLDIVSSKEESTNRYPAFMDLVKRQLLQDYKEDDLHNEGLRIFTTLDPRMQELAERAMVGTIQDLRRSSPALQGSFIVTSPDNAEVLALVSDAQPSYAGFNRVLDAQRPVGSIIKPAVYLTALERDNYDLNTIVKDQPVRTELTSGQIWQPSNFDKKIHGNVFLQDALVHSYNLATANLGMDVGLRQVIRTLERLGIKKPLQPLPSLLLGSVELSPFEVTSMYQTIAANGFSSPIHVIREVLDNRGKPLARYPLEVQQVFDPVPIYLLQSALQQVMWRGTGSPAYRSLPSHLAFAGKTGTTDDNRDSWFVGMSGNYLAVAWVGNDNNSPTHLTGAAGALKLWTAFMRQAQPTPLNLAMPAEVQRVWLDRQTGGLSRPECQNSVQLALKKSHVPTEYGPCVERIDPSPAWLDALFDDESASGAGVPAATDLAPTNHPSVGENPNNHLETAGS